jgi:hypothetical protein
MKVREENTDIKGFTSAARSGVVTVEFEKLIMAV